MAISLKDLTHKKAPAPARILIFGPPGMGKTTAAAEFPEPIFLQTEDGYPSDMPDPPARFEREQLGGFDGLMDAIGALYSEPHDYCTVVIDSLDKLEPWVWEKTCRENNWATIETPGYGKGYLAAEMQWREILGGLNALRRERGMAIVLIAHSTIETVNDPTTVAYSRYDIRLQKRAVALFQDEMDAILFVNQDVTIKHDDPKAKSSRSRADGGGNRWIYAAPRPAFVAKNRFGIPDKIMCARGETYAELAKYLPAPSERTGEAVAA